MFIISILVLVVGLVLWILHVYKPTAKKSFLFSLGLFIYCGLGAIAISPNHIISFTIACIFGAINGYNAFKRFPDAYPNSSFFRSKKPNKHN